MGYLEILMKLTLASDSIIPHVRTDIVDYLQEGDKFTIDRLQFNSFCKSISRIFIQNLVLESLRECLRVMVENFYIDHLKKLCHWF